MFETYHYLYVEDDPLSREVMQVAMADVMGVTTLTMFEDSTDFMPRLRALPHPPDLILLDIHVEPHSGFDLLAMIRQDPAYQGCAIIAVTASVMTQEVEKLRTSGFNGMIGKPLDVVMFPELVRRILQGESVWQVD